MRVDQADDEADDEAERIPAKVFDLMALEYHHAFLFN